MRLQDFDFMERKKRTSKNKKLILRLKKTNMIIDNLTAFVQEN